MILPYRQGCALDSVIPRANSAVMHFIDLRQRMEHWLEYRWPTAHGK